MLKQIISTVVLILFACASFSIGLISCGTASKAQAQTQESQAKKTAAGQNQDQTAKKESAVIKQGKSIASVLIPELHSDKGVQKNMGSKSDQILSIWESLKVTKGVVNILLAAQAAGTESLSPVDIIMGKLSNLLSFAFSLMLFWKILLTLSSYMIFLAVIPVCAIIIVILIWTYKDRKKMPKLIISTVLISLLLTFTIPFALQLSSVLDGKLFANDINTLVVSIDEKGKSAETMDKNVSTARRQSGSIVSYIGNAKSLSNGIIEDVINYYMIFIFVYLFIPVLLIIVIFFLARYFLKFILTKK